MNSKYKQGSLQASSPSNQELNQVAVVEGLKVIGDAATKQNKKLNIARQMAQLQHQEAPPDISQPDSPLQKAVQSGLTEESQLQSLPDSARVHEAEVEAEYSVQVKNLGRKRQHFPQRKPQFAARPARLTIPPPKSPHQAVQYDGHISSPHIKPEYINDRLNTPSNMMRAKSIGQDSKQIPVLTGTTIVKPPIFEQKIQEENQKKTAQVSKKDAGKNPGTRQSLSHMPSRINQDIISGEGSFPPQARKQPLQVAIGARQVLSKQAPMSKVEVLSAISSKSRPGPHHIELSLDNSTQKDDAASTVNQQVLNRVNTMQTAGGRGVSPSPTSKGHHTSSQYFTENRFKPGLNTSNQCMEKPPIQGGSHVQLTDFLASKKREEQNKIQMAEQKVDVASDTAPVFPGQQDQGTSAAYFSNQSIDAITGVITDYQNQSPARALVPKLESQDKIQIIADNEQAKQNLQSATSSIGEGVNALEFDYGSARPSQNSGGHCGQFDTRPLDSREDGSYNVKNDQRGQAQMQQQQHQQPFNFEPQPFVKGQLKIIPKQMEPVELSPFLQQSAQSNVNSRKGKARINKLSAAYHSTDEGGRTTKSVMNRGQTIGYAKLSTGMAHSTHYQGGSAVPSQAKLEQDGGFKLVAERKEVVVNKQAETAKIIRKRQAMSKNEIKRQSDLLRNLPLLANVNNQRRHNNINNEQMDRANLTSPPQGSTDRCQTSPQVQTKSGGYEIAQITKIGEDGSPMHASPSNNEIYIGRSGVVSPQLSTVHNKPNGMEQTGMTAVSQELSPLKIQDDEVVNEEVVVSTTEGVTEKTFDERNLPSTWRHPQVTQKNDGQVNLTTVSNWDQQNLNVKAKHWTQTDFNSQMMISQENGNNYAYNRPYMGQGRGGKRINTSHGVSNGYNKAQKLRMSQLNPTTQKIQTSQNLIGRRPQELVSSNDFLSQARAQNPMIFSDTQFSQDPENQLAATSIMLGQQDVVQYFDRRSQSKSIGGPVGRITAAIANKHKRYKSQQRQLKGLFNLGELKSKNVQNIKISRLNDLARREDNGNPLHQINMIQQEIELRSSKQPKGGVQTQYLQHFNAEAKFQNAAIQDFACKESLYNRTQGFSQKKDALSRMPLKKLIGRQTILMPKAGLSDYSVAAQGDPLAGTYSKNPIPRRLEDSLMHGESLIESTTDKMSKSMMRKLLNDYKFGGSAHQVHLSVKGQQAGLVEGADDLPENPIDTLNEEISFNQRVRVEANSSALTQQHDSISMSPACQSIKLHPKDFNSKHKQVAADVAARSRQKASSRAKNTRTHHTFSEMSATQTRLYSHNQDMAEMLYQPGAETSSNGQALTCDNQIQETEKVSLTAEPENQGERMVETPMKNIIERASNISRDGGATSDGGGSDTALLPKNILDKPQTPSESLRAAKIKKIKSSEKTKQQVYSRYEESNTDLTPAAGVTPQPQAAEEGNRVISSLMADNKIDLMKSDEEVTTPKSDQQQNFGNASKNTVLGVKSVHIQKTKPNGRQTKQQKTTTNNEIKLVDQSLDKKEHESHFTVVRKSFRESSVEQSSPKGLDTLIKSKQESESHRKIAISQNLSHEVLSNSSRKRNVAPIQQFVSEENIDAQKNIGPANMLNLIAKKVDKAKGSVLTHERSINNTQQTERQQADIFDQLNVMNQMLGQNSHSGYHQLEPKLFPANSRALEQARKRKSGVPSNQTSISHTDTHGQNGHPQNAHTSGQSNMSNNTKRLHSNKNSINSSAPPNSNTNWFKSQQVQSNELKPEGSAGGIAPSQEEDDDEEMAFVAHKAMDNRFKGQRLSRHKVEMKKREFAQQRNKHIKSVDSYNVSISSQPRVQQAGSPMRPQQATHLHHVRPRLNSINDMFVSSVNSGEGPSSIVSNEEPLNLNNQNVPKPDYDIRKIKTIEKDISKSINIEQLLGHPLERLYQELDAMIGTGTAQKDMNSLTIDTEMTLDPQASGRNADKKHDSLSTVMSKRKGGSGAGGLLRMSTLQISHMYRDNFKYEFEENELYKLLDEQTEHQAKTRRYFLKFSSIQIVNIDCQSGILTDMQPISIPMSKMINLFFFSADQLQQVLSQTLCLRKDQGQIKLRIDQDKLREITYKTLPRVIRDDYFSAPLKINIVEQIGGQDIIQEQFNAEIRMPRLEIITSAQEFNRANSSDELLKTTMTHHLTGAQMLTLMQEHHLVDWVTFAQKLIKQRVFGVDQMQADGDASVIKFQRLDHKQDFVLYKDPVQLAQEEKIAKNLQLTLMMQPKLILQIEHYQPLYLQLRINLNKRQQVMNDEEEEESEIEHLPGYLPPDYVKPKHQTTVARMQIPFAKLPFIKQTFGDKINSGKGCLLECLYSLVQVFVDPSKNLCRLSVPNWSQLEDINVRKLSFQYFREQKLNNLTQQENLKYLGKKSDVKQIIGGALGASQKQVFQGSKKQAADKKNLVFKQPSKQQRNAPSTSAVENHPSAAAVTKLLSPSVSKDTQKFEGDDDDDTVLEKRLELNNILICHLKIGKVIKTTYSIEFNNQDNQSFILSAESQYTKQQHKMTLEEILQLSQDQHF